MSDRIKEIFPTIQLKPHMFKEYLEIIGFEHLTTISKDTDVKEGKQDAVTEQIENSRDDEKKADSKSPTIKINRPIYVFRKK